MAKGGILGIATRVKAEGHTFVLRLSDACSKRSKTMRAKECERDHLACTTFVFCLNTSWDITNFHLLKHLDAVLELLFAGFFILRASASQIPRMTIDQAAQSNTDETKSQAWPLSATL